jgi:hypothetical protein
MDGQTQLVSIPGHDGERHLLFGARSTGEQGPMHVIRREFPRGWKYGNRGRSVMFSGCEFKDAEMFSATDPLDVVCFRACEGTIRPPEANCVCLTGPNPENRQDLGRFQLAEFPDKAFFATLALQHLDLSGGFRIPRNVTHVKVSNCTVGGVWSAGTISNLPFSPHVSFSSCRFTDSFRASNLGKPASVEISYCTGGLHNAMTRLGNAIEIRVSGVLCKEMTGWGNGCSLVRITVERCEFHETLSSIPPGLASIHIRDCKGWKNIKAHTALENSAKERVAVYRSAPETYSMGAWCCPLLPSI